MGMETAQVKGNEMVQIVDENNKPVKGVQRWIMRKHNLAHRSSYVFIYNSKKQLYVQMRTATKDYLPNYYSLATGGVVQLDEPDLANAEREVEEEVGIINPKLNYVKINYYEDDKTKVWQNIYTLKHEGPVKHQESEIDHIEIWDIDEVMEKEKKGEKITPDSIAAFKLIYDSLKPV